MKKDIMLMTRIKVDVTDNNKFEVIEKRELSLSKNFLNVFVLTTEDTYMNNKLFDFRNILTFYSMIEEFTEESSDEAIIAKAKALLINKSNEHNISFNRRNDSLFN